MIQVTSAMAVKLARKIHLKTTTVEARAWLIRNKQEIEWRLREATQDAIEDVLNEITLCEWPKPAFDKIYRQIEMAVEDAIENYEESHNVESRTMTLDEKKLCEKAHTFLRYKGVKPKRAWLAVDICFGQRGADRTVNQRQIPYMFELIYHDGKIRAAITERL